MSKSFTGKVCVVTGAGSGIGRATAQRFARDGATLVVSDINKAAAEETVELIEADGGIAHAYVLDVADAAAWERFAADVDSAHGGVDVLVNNAGIVIFGGVLDQSLADWERLIAINLMGVVHGCRTFAARMVQRGQGGHIVNPASLAAYTPNRLSPSYSVAKAGVLMLSECLRAELAEHGIGVTAICPGLIDTNIAANGTHAAVTAQESARRSANMDALQGRFGAGPDKVGQAIASAVRHDSAIRPVRPEAWALWWLHRLSPGSLRFVARHLNNERSARLIDTLRGLLNPLLSRATVPVPGPGAGVAAPGDAAGSVVEQRL